MWLERTFNTLGIGGENPALVSVVRPRSLDYLRVIFGLILLYDAWTSLSFTQGIQALLLIGSEGVRARLGDRWLAGNVVAYGQDHDGR